MDWIHNFYDSKIPIRSEARAATVSGPNIIFMIFLQLLPTVGLVRVRPDVHVSQLLLAGFSFVDQPSLVLQDQVLAPVTSQTSLESNSNSTCLYSTYNASACFGHYWKPSPQNHTAGPPSSGRSFINVKSETGTDTFLVNFSPPLLYLL